MTCRNLTDYADYEAELTLEIGEAWETVEIDFREDMKQPEWTATLYDLLSAYATQRARSALSRVEVKKRTVWSLAEARVALDRLIGQSSDWSRIDQFLLAYVVEPSLAATVFASSFASALELVREGLAEIHQKESFAPIYMRKRVGANGSAATHDAQENA
jgi:segregation and condensation protein A